MPPARHLRVHACQREKLEVDGPDIGPPPANGIIKQVIDNIDPIASQVKIERVPPPEDHKTRENDKADRDEFNLRAELAI